MEKNRQDLPEGKEQFNRAEVEAIISRLEESHRAEMVEVQRKLLELKKQNEYWSLEHEKSLVLLVENASQKMQLEDLNTKLEHAFQQLEKESKTDALTKLLNRGALIEAIQREIKQISRTKESILKKLEKWKDKRVNEIDEENFFSADENFGILVCAIMDIDHFKAINDTYGHLSGDMVLKAVGKILNDRRLLRTTDITGRFGGEEFLLVFPQTSLEHALIPLEKIRTSIKEKVFTLDDNSTFGIKVSIGVAEYRKSDDSIEMMIKRADEALYYAKENGRDMVILYGSFPAS